MFCSACGTAIPAGQGACPQCGRPLAPAVPPIPGFEYEVQRYSNGIRVLAIVWFAFAGLTLLAGFAALVFAHTFMLRGFGPWAIGPYPPMWLNMVVRFGWLLISIRAGLAFVVGYGLIERAQWGKVVAIIAAILSLFHFPFGTALGIWTLVMLLGYRNSALYAQL